MKLIFVDDCEIWREDMEDVAADIGIEIQTYSEPSQVNLEKVCSADIVITDNKFGALGYLGIGLIRSIRAHGYSGRVILYTNYPRPVDIRDTEELEGIVINKSMYPQALLESLGVAMDPSSQVAAPV